MVSQALKGPGSTHHPPSFNQQLSSSASHHSQHASPGPEAALLPGQVDGTQAQFQVDRRTHLDYSDVASSPVLLTTVLDAALYDLTDRCYNAFERLIEAGGGLEPLSYESSGATPHDLTGLKNSFAFWVDYTGALAPVGASLDDRLIDCAEIKKMIIELLEIVERNIDQRVFSLPHV